MAETPFLDEDSSPSIKYFSSSLINGATGEEQQNYSFKSVLNEDNLVPSENYFGSKINGNTIYSEQIEQQITNSLDQLCTKTDQISSSDDDDDSLFEGKYRKRARVGNHYQARIPKYLSDSGKYADEDELLWDPFIMDADSVENFLRRISSITKLLLPMGTHLRDDEKALYILLQNQHDVESAFRILSTSQTVNDQLNVWSEEECRNFERGLLNFGKNFFLIQKYRVTTRCVGELVQFYYLWKKTERYDLFANRIRGGNKKYALNPGISDLMCRYLGGQRGSQDTVTADMQLIMTDTRTSIPQESSQY